MSSFYDDASLVVIPSGYKTSKVYAEKPTDGSGDLAFTRTGDTASRVNSAGLIERVRTNLVNYSEDLTNAAWNNVNQVTITANAGVSPNGTTTADRLLSTGSSWFFSRNVSLTSGIPYTISVYVKSNTGSSQTFTLFGNNSDVSPNFTATTSWQRFSFTITAASGSLAQGIARDSSNSAGDLLVWGFQLETGDIATAYIPTTTAAVSVGPVANVPRLDYTGSTCPRLLLEPQRTNILNFSECFDNAYWNKAGTTITANNTTSPDGYVNADRLTSSGASGDEYIQRAGLTTTAGTYTSSIFVKNVNATQTLLMAVHLGEGSITSDLRYTWSTGAVTTNGTNAVSGKATSYGNGWVRLEFTYTIGASVTGHWFRTYVQTGVSTNSIFIYGASVELGAYATSYIPTLAASATRGADACSKTGISSLIGQTEGTLFAEIQYFDNIAGTAELVPFYIGTGTFLTSIYITIYQDVLYCTVWNGGVQEAIINCGSLTAGVHKVAAGYSNGFFVAYLDGVQKGTYVPGSIPACSQVFLGTAGGSTSIEAYKLSQALLFKTRLTNTELATLTTL